jgi:hypothetical protein
MRNPKKAPVQPGGPPLLRLDPVVLTVQVTILVEGSQAISAEAQHDVAEFAIPKKDHNLVK